MSRGVVGALSTVHPWLGWAWYRYRDRGARQEAVAALTEVVRRLPELPGLPPPSQWSVQRVVATDTSATVAVYADIAGVPVAVGRVVPAARDDGPLRRNDAALRALRSDPHLQPLHALLPAPLAFAEHDAWTCAVEGAVPGVPARAAARDPLSARRILPLVAGVAGTLSERTSRSTTVDDEVLGRWVTRPLEAVRRARPDAHGTDALEHRLRGHLLGRTCATSWTHGDLWLGNVLLDEGAERVRGLVDWDAASDQGVHLVDLLHLLLTTRTAFERTHLGEAVREVLDGRPWAAEERQILAEVAASSANCLPEDVAVILMWLIHVEGVLGKNGRSVSDGTWFDRNIEPVLQWC